MELISSTEIVEQYDVSRKTIQRWVKYGKLVPVKRLTGRTGAHLFNLAEVEKLLGAKRK